MDTSKNQTSAPRGVSCLYDLKVESLLGKPTDLSTYRGQVALVVNVASHCGYTPQYAGLEQLHREFQDKGFVVLGFPSNDFGEQEPGTPQQISDFCAVNYGTTFPMFAKVSTLAGPGQSPVYRYLGASGHLPEWNFGKYLVGRDGQVQAFFQSDVEPDAVELRQALADALQKTACAPTPNPAESAASTDAN